ncbi:hypothetical protein [Oceanicoccus sagamiensis]|uniref:DUF2846 domain-containing protein n=1 Tax=Oceanicoccus sagamiensis TaxID=716816 RepID=A0A1X9N5M8_9GAMM|nr:hypothetical protein [Oceanicoccus sagamiensis]ARN73036.1 hypothetical protein BST96_02280 [Oceanicoccus sagamiensis]
MTKYAKGLIGNVIVLLVGLVMVGQVSAEQSKAMDSAAKAAPTSQIIVLRGLERPKTRSLNFTVYVGEERLGRVKVNSTQTMDVEAGTYTVRSNFYKDKPLEISVMPGKTYYLVAKMDRRGGNFKSVYELVTEDYAYNMMPSLSEVESSI